MGAAARASSFGTAHRRKRGIAVASITDDVTHRQAPKRHGKFAQPLQHIVYKRNPLLEVIAMKLIGKALALGFAVATASVVACSTGPHQSTGQNLPAPTPEDGTGTVGLQYTLPGGEHISTISYSLTDGTPAHTYTGTVNVAGSSSISFVVGGVAAGSGYNITVTATSDDGTVTCSGSAGPFSVTARATTTVNVNLICQTGNNDAGSVLVNAPTSNCPVWNTVVANPSKALLGQTVTLTASANAPDPGNVTFTWTTTGAATITSNTATLNAADSGKNDTAIFTCPTAAGETDTVTLVVSDGPVPDGGACPTTGTTATLTITCGKPPACTLPGESTGRCSGHRGRCLHRHRPCQRQGHGQQRRC
jgi:hypothetical protein